MTAHSARHFLILSAIGVVLVASPRMARAEVTFLPGAGFAYLATSHSPARVGLGLEGALEVRLMEALGLRFHVGWGITEWDRAGKLADFGYSAGSWTVGAYASVTNWLTRGDPKWLLFKLMGSFFAYLGLTVGFAVAGLAYLFTPLAATSFFSGGATAAGHFKAGSTDAFVEGGMGGLLYMPAGTNASGAGLGPIVGMGIQFGRIGFSLRAIWVPPVLQSKTTSGYATAAMGTVSWAM